MNKKEIREKIIDTTGYWIYSRTLLPVGADVFVDLKKKVGIALNTIFDVGANIGQTALEFSKHFPGARIHSFEPIADTFRDLNKNVESNPQIKCHHLALADKKESFTVKTFSGTNSVLNSLKENAMNDSANAKEETIQTDTLDNFIVDQNINTIDLLKIDTEGYEIPVLKGAANSLREKKITMIYLEVGFSRKNKRNTYLPDILKIMEEYEFTLFGFYEIHHYDIENQMHFGNALFIQNSLLKNNAYY